MYRPVTDDSKLVFQNEGPMGHEHSKIELFHTGTGNVDITIVDNTFTQDDLADRSPRSKTVVLNKEQIKQLTAFLREQMVFVPEPRPNVEIMRIYE